MKFISNKNQIPKEPHYAILLFGSIYIPGDERSRTNPGHGYPASTETKIDYIVFDNINEMNQWVLSHQNYPYSYIPIYSQALDIKIEAKVIVPPVTR